MVEHMMGNLVKVTHAEVTEGRNPLDLLSSFLREYRATRHISTGKSPSKLLMEHTNKTRLPNPPILARNDDVDFEVRKKDREQKQKYKEYMNNRCWARDVEINPRDFVVIKAG